MKLQTLSLDGHPAHDVMGGTLAAWVEAICTGRDFNEQDDAPRFRRAFATLMQRESRWPSPARFLEALPSNVTPFRKPKLLESEKTRKARVASFAEIAKKLNMPRPDDEGPEAA
jgi:hypothetical protein